MIKVYTKKTLIFLTLALLFLVPMISAYAQTANVSNNSVNLSATLDNPLGAGTTLPVLIANLLKLIAQIGAVVCVFFIIYSGFLFIKAQGDPGEITKAKSVFFWSIIGTAILLGAAVIAELIKGTVNSVIGI
jgi:beta-lactamase regulating signal transducer with metallopeptidase domain